MRLSRGIAVLVLIAACSAASAADNPRNGERLAKEWCTVCHRTAPDQPTTDTNAEAPSFMAIAANREKDADYLLAFMQQQKLPMTTFRFDEPELRDIVAYILRLRPAGNGE